MSTKPVPLKKFLEVAKEWEDNEDHILQRLEQLHSEAKEKGETGTKSSTSPYFLGYIIALSDPKSLFTTTKEQQTMNNEEMLLDEEGNEFPASDLESPGHEDLVEANYKEVDDEELEEILEEIQPKKPRAPKANSLKSIRRLLFAKYDILPGQTFDNWLSTIEDEDKKPLKSARSYKNQLKHLAREYKIYAPDIEEEDHEDDYTEEEIQMAQVA